MESGISGAGTHHVVRPDRRCAKAMLVALAAAIGASTAEAGVVTTSIVSEAEVNIVATTFTEPFPNDVESREVKLRGTFSTTEKVTSVLAEAKEPIDFFPFFSGEAFQNVDGLDYVRVRAEHYGAPVRVSSLTAHTRYIVNTAPILVGTRDPNFGFHITGGAIEIANLGDTQATVHLRAMAGRGNHDSNVDLLKVDDLAQAWVFDALLLVDGASGSLLPVLDTSASNPLGIGLPGISYSYDAQTDGFKVTIDAFNGNYDFHDQLIYELTAEISGDLGLTGITAWIADPSEVTGPPAPSTIDGVLITALPMTTAVPLPPALLLLAGVLPVLKRRRNIRDRGMAITPTAH